MRRYRVIAMLLSGLLLLFAIDLVLEALVTRSLAFHSGSGAERVRQEFAGYPWSEQIDAAGITRLAGSENWPGEWRTYSTSHGLWLHQGIACSVHQGSVATRLRFAAWLLEEHEPDPQRRRSIAQQLLRCAQADDQAAIKNWVEQANDSVEEGKPLPDLPAP